MMAIIEEGSGTAGRPGWMPGRTDPASIYAEALLFAYCANLAAAVMTTVRADDVGWLELLTLRAGTKRHRLQRVVRAALGRPRLGVSAFRIRHVSTLRTPRLSVRLLLQEGAQASKPRILPAHVARARALIQVRAAARTQALALFAAQRPH